MLFTFNPMAFMRLVGVNVSTNPTYSINFNVLIVISRVIFYSPKSFKKTDFVTKELYNWKNNNITLIRVGTYMVM